MRKIIAVATLCLWAAACSSGPSTGEVTTAEAQTEQVNEPFTVAFVDSDGNALTEMETTVRQPTRSGHNITVKVELKNVGSKPFHAEVFNAGYTAQVIDQNDRTFDGEVSNLASEEDVQLELVVGPADYSFNDLQPGESGWQKLHFNLPPDVEPTTLMLSQHIAAMGGSGEPIPVSLK